MQKITIVAVAIFISAVAGLGAGVASDASEDAKLLSAAKLGIVDAITIAEKIVGGTAYEAELENEDGTIVYEVEVIKDGKEFEVLIDAITGAVLSTEEEHEDDGHDQKQTGHASD